MKARLPRFLRLRSFWLGLPAFLFLLWVWRDSMIHVAALHWQRGAPVTMEWPPAETGMYLRSPEPELQPDPPAHFDLEELSSYSETGAAIQPPLLESGLVHHPDEVWTLSGGGLHRVRRQEFQARFEEIRTYRSTGSHAGALWFSDWRSSRPLPEREYRPTAQSESGFPAPEMGRGRPDGKPHPPPALLAAHPHLPHIVGFPDVLALAKAHAMGNRRELTPSMPSGVKTCPFGRIFDREVSQMIRFNLSL